MHKADYLAALGKAKDAVVAHPIVSVVVAACVALAVGKFVL